ncbi:LysR family transcriptional regulator [Hydrocarboniclastica marina]|uniref:LysR family transcriptional regulator n=1 Tax=Hydrocarboniclastica marina TaxID=2259620 RepID=A0A4P7XEK4_9ALTE|nr:LysR family transcriptional regulator [Hydrocarboniclastica marina]MAL97476.1 LysR family transcriptional regulator [Alteromonadaceae bacterium]QCF24824.1 LysR family transcriptional regulator [Hydrocarboniclastica marina]
MKHLNYKHLHYFWVIAREGSIARASESLDLAPQTLSGQLASLEEAVGGLLFQRKGRNLVLTDLGRTVFSYTNEMFGVAEELKQVLNSNASERPVHLAVGIVASIHKLIAYRLIEPAMELDRQIVLRCSTGSLEHLMHDLKRYRLDLVLTDQLPKPDKDFAAHSFELVTSTISIFAAPALAGQLRPGFPGSLDNQPFLANVLESPYLHRLMQWLAEQGVRPRIRAEVDDSALIKVFASHGAGAFAAPTLIGDEVCRQYQVEEVGRIQSITESLFAITGKRRSGNPAVGAICGSRAD